MAVSALQAMQKKADVLDTSQVSLMQSNGLIRKEMNDKVAQNLYTVLQPSVCEAFLADKIVKYESLSDLSITDADKIVQQAVNKHLGAGRTMSSVLTEMGGNLWENYRIYRDLIYTKQDRKSRLLSCFKGLLAKAKANAKRDMAYI